jgi:hypothetical protein
MVHHTLCGHGYERSYSTSCISPTSLLPSTASNDIQQHVNSANSGDVDNDSQSDCHSDLDSCVPEVMVPDARALSSIKNEQKYPLLYDSVVHQVYLCKFVNCFVVILLHHNNLLLLALTLVQYDRYSITGHPN